MKRKLSKKKAALPEKKRPEAAAPQNTQESGNRLHPMSRKEAGRRGGKVVAAKYGPDFYRQIGHLGGEKVAEEYGTDFYRDIGRKGGLKVVEEYGPDFYRDIGRKGGLKVAEEYGSDFYRDIGHRGGLAKHHRGKQSSRQELKNYTHYNNECYIS